MSDRAQMLSDYWAGKWCGDCRYGVVEDPPCCTRPDREPQPTDGPDYHADHAAWRFRNRDAQ